MAGNSIFNGTDTLIHQCLGLRPNQTLKQKSTSIRLSSNQIHCDAISRLVGELANCVENNWRGRIPSIENWRSERQTNISDRNKSPEIVLERAWATLAELGYFPDWYNQIPVASGLIDGKSDKRAAVDLVRIGDSEVELVELKWASDTPVYAAFEILRYGLAYLLCMKHREIFGYSEKPMLQVDQVNLMVLAPYNYFEQYRLGFLADGIRAGLLALPKPSRLTLNFGFYRFPEGFELPVTTGTEVEKLRIGKLSDRRDRLLSAIDLIEPVWETDR